MSTKPPTLFQRIILPGFAFKAVVIGGGYATGRELATFFMPAGPIGGLLGMALAGSIWSVICAITFVFAFRTGSHDYRAFFKALLGPAWPIFEVAYALAIIVTLAVFAAAAGAIGAALFGWPPLLGALVLIAAIATMAAFGNAAVEGLFKYVTFFLYGTYILFVVLSFSTFGDRIQTALTPSQPIGDWLGGGLTYAGYNIIGAVVILPVTRHLTSSRDAIVAGLLAGPFAMIPAIAFFLCMIAFYPAIQSELLPSDYLLEQLNQPAFRVLFQLMIFSALLESGAGGVHAVNERIASVYEARLKRPLTRVARLTFSGALLIGSVFIAGQFGLAALIAQGFKWLSFLFLAIYIAPLLTYGLWRILKRRPELIDVPL